MAFVTPSLAGKVALLGEAHRPSAPGWWTQRQQQEQHRRLKQRLSCANSPLLVHEQQQRNQGVSFVELRLTGMALVSHAARPPSRGRVAGGAASIVAAGLMARQRHRLRAADDAFLTQTMVAERAEAQTAPAIPTPAADLHLADGPGAPGDLSTRPSREVKKGARAGENPTATQLVSSTGTSATSMSKEGGRGGRGGGGRGLRRRRPGEGRGRGANRGTKPAFLRSREFVLKIRSMSRWNWRGVLEELEAAEEKEVRFAEADKGKHGACDGKASVHMYNSCLMHLAKCARWREALAVFERMSAKGVTPNSFCLNATLDACATAGEWKQCLSILETAKASGLEVNEISYNICIAACGSGRQWQKALELLREIQASGRRRPEKSKSASPRTVAAAAAASARGGKNCGGGGRITPTVGTFGATIKALGMSGRWEESIEIFRELQALSREGQARGAAVDEPGVAISPPDVVTYTTLVAALGQNGRTVEARQIWDEMEASGVAPNAVTYHAMIAAHGNAAATSRDDNLAAVDAANSAEAKAIASVSSQTTLVPQLQPRLPPRRAEWAEAILLFDEMSRNGLPHSTNSYGAVITVAGQCGLWQEATALVERMHKEGRVERASGMARANPKGQPLAPNNFIYTAAMNACGINGQWREALRLLREMPDKGVEADALSYSTAISILAKEFQLEEAFRIMREMSERGVAAGASSACCEGIVQVYGRTTQARTEELVAFVRSMEKPDFFAYSTAITVCAAAAAAETTSASKSARGLPSLHTCSTSGSIDNDPDGQRGAASNQAPTDASSNEAPALLQEMVAAGLRPDETCFTNALSACRDARQGKEAVTILREMKATGLPLDGVVYTLAMTACGGAGDWEEAVALVREMSGNGVQPSLISYSVAISACAKASQHKPALELMQEMEDAGINPNIVTYSSAILACAAAGEWEHAVNLLRELSKKGLLPTRACYASAIKACALAGNVKMALSLLREMPEVGLVPDALCYSAALSGVGGGSDCDGVVAALKEIREAGLTPSSSVYVGAAKACRDSGSLTQADTIEKMSAVIGGRVRGSGSA